MREIESNSSLLEKNPEPLKGIEAEKGIAEFLATNFGCIVEVDRNRSEIDDRNGIDMVADIEAGDGKVYKLLLEVSSPDTKRRKEKVARQWKMPLVVRHDEHGEAITDPLPRALIGYNVGFLLSRQREAEKLGIPINNVLGEDERAKLKSNLLDEILKQIDILSANREYAKKTKAIKEALEKERNQLKIAA